jgi:hypothetical protein
MKKMNMNQRKEVKKRMMREKTSLIASIDFLSKAKRSICNYTTML